MTITLMSDRMRLTLEPDFGARITSLTDLLRSGRQWLVKGPCTGGADDQAGYGVAEARGWDECFPTIGKGHNPVWIVCATMGPFGAGRGRSPPSQPAGCGGLRSTGLAVRAAIDTGSRCADGGLPGDEPVCAGPALSVVAARLTCNDAGR